MITIQMGLSWIYRKTPYSLYMGLKKGNVQPTGYQSFVFQTKNLDSTIERLKKKESYSLKLPNMIKELMKFV